MPNTPDPQAAREAIRRALAEADGFAYENLEPHDYQRHADALLALPPAVVPSAAETTNRAASDAVREQLLAALDFSYCQTVGYDTPEALLDAYDATQSVPPPADRAALRDRIAALFRNPPGAARLGDATPGEIADAVLAVLPAQADQAAVLLEAADDLATAFGDPMAKHIGLLGAAHLRRRARSAQTSEAQPETPMEKRLRYSERRNDELRAECKRRGKNVLEQSLKIVALERQIDEVRSQLGAEILRAGQAETELRRVAAEEQPTETQDGEADADTVAKRAAQVISTMGADIRALTQERNRYRTAWHNARARAADAEDNVRVVEAETHSCRNCEGVDPNTCLTHPDRPKPPPMDPVHILGIGVDDAERPAVGEQPDTQTREARCAHNDVAYGLCIFAAAHDGDCFHERQPIREDDSDEWGDGLCDSEYPGDDHFVGQLCALPDRHFADHRRDERISGTSHTALLRWPNRERP